LLRPGEEFAWKPIYLHYTRAVLALTPHRCHRRPSPFHSSSDRGIVTALRRASAKRPDYWDFREHIEELASQRLFQYPAMMVPEMQKQVIKAILRKHPEIQTLADPFLGSGTILALAMLHGRQFIGQDINPLSLLISKTRAFSLDYVELLEAVERVYSRARLDRTTCYAVRFKRQAKWFAKAANIALSRLTFAIRKESSVHSRRFLWVCLAETVRLNSNSRTSTYKLHVRPASQRHLTVSDVLECFNSISHRNVQIVEEFQRILRQAGHLDSNGRYKHSITIRYGDSARRFPRDRRANRKPDLVITSPSYGDNRTTVPYGQAAWLPLRWIDTKDISHSIPPDLANGMYDVDNRSLGGRRPRNLPARRKVLGSRNAAAVYADELASLSRDGYSRFVHFVYDFRRALRHIAAGCREGGHIVLTLGERNISGTVCPLAEICIDLLKSFGIEEVTHIVRHIPSKRMAEKNRHSATITREYVSIFRKSVKA